MFGICVCCRELMPKDELGNICENCAINCPEGKSCGAGKPLPKLNIELVEFTDEDLKNE